MRKRYFVLLAVVLAFAAASLLVWSRLTPKPPPVYGEGLPQTCRDLKFESVAYVVCEVDLKTYDITLHRLDGGGKPYGSVAKFDEDATKFDRPVLLSMNAGMYHDDLSPVGLYVENGQQQAPLNTGDAEGNFFLKPNGVFFIGKDGRAGVLETSAYAAAHPDVSFATQSGPMLAVDGKLHPKFEENGESRYIRNGVGVREDGSVILAISREKVSLGSFARLFLNQMECPNALFLDGDISALSNGSKLIVGGGDKARAGPILAVSAKE